MYSVLLTPKAVRELNKLSPEIRPRIIARLEELSANPHTAEAKRLVGPERMYRIREGAYRIIYVIGETELTVLVVGVGHRREIYRKLRGRV